MGGKENERNSSKEEAFVSRIFFIPSYFKSIFVLKAVVIRSAQVLLHSHTPSS
jgi:hypothetical protein